MKTIAVLLATAMISFTGVAQNPDEGSQSMNASGSSKSDDGTADDSPFLLGFRYMPTFSNFDLYNSEGGALETTFTLGHGFGGLIGVNFNEHVGMQAEVIYTELSQKYRDGSLDHKVKLNYVNIPLMIVLHTNYNAGVNFNVAVGPQFGINTGSKIETSGVSEGDSVHAVLAVKPADFGIA